jgi:hypothetical protein
VTTLDAEVEEGAHGFDLFDASHSFVVVIFILLVFSYVMGWLPRIF